MQASGNFENFVNASTKAYEALYTKVNQNIGTGGLMTDLLVLQSVNADIRHYLKALVESYF